MKKDLLLILLISCSFLSCSKEIKPESQETPQSPRTYSTNSVLINNLPPIMGGYVDSNGSLMTFSLQLLGNDPLHNEIILSAKILKIDTTGESHPIYDFNDMTFSHGYFMQDSVAGYLGWLAEGIRVNMVSNNNEGIYFSSNCTGAINIIQYNSINDLQYINAVISLTTNRKKGIFAITAPSYTGNYPYAISSPPAIYEIDSLNVKSVYFTFPDNIEFRNNCGYYGSETKMYPSDILIDMVSEGNGNLYVSFGYDNIIYKIDKDKKLSTIIDNIHNPVSVAIDNFNRLFVVSGPEFAKGSNNLFEMTKPVEVILINNSVEETIYTGELKNFSGCFSDKKINGIYSVSDANYNISINPSGEIYLEDPLARQVILIK
jgi:hypothetical protein